MPPLPPVLQQQGNNRSLDVAVAWEFALAWHAKLKNKVLLEATRDSVHKSYEWVRFEISVAERSEISAARAAALAWFAISRCPGYGAHENPVFWKCVFSELTQCHINASRASDRQNVTDAHGFFDGDGVEFPRFRLPLSQYHANVRLFCGVPGEQLESQDMAKIKGMVEVLAPWIDRERTVYRPVVSLSNLYLAYYTGSQANRPATEPSPKNELSRLLSDSHNASTTASLSDVTFSVNSLTMEGNVSGENATEAHELMNILNQHDVEITWLDLWNGKKISREMAAALVRTVLPAPDSGVASKTTTLVLTHFSDALIPAFISALPFSTTLRSIRLEHGTTVKALDEPCFAWLAYALFHPDTPSSAWKRVNLFRTAMDEDRVTILQAMARGNNLATLLNGSLLLSSDGYYQATLVAGASVYDQPDKVETLVTSDGTTTVDVCGVSVVDPLQWGDWVQVVVPAYGLGWVSSADVASVVRRAPAEAALTHFSMDRQVSKLDNSSVLAGMLKLIGPRLEHLYIQCARHIKSADELQQALVHCPSLKSLIVPHNGELWSDVSAPDLLPRLCELQLHTIDAPSLGETLMLPHLPRSLQVLRIDASRVFGHSTARELAGARQILSRPSNLRVFHWQDGLHKSHHPTPYTETCDYTKRRLEELGVTPQPLLPRTVAAFLSVLTDQAACGSAQRIDADMAKTIIKFAGTRPRSIVLEPPATEIPQDRHYHLLLY